MKQEAFIDTGGFVAWLVRSDRQHDAAAALFARPPGPVATSLAVVAEAYGYFLRKHGEDAARTFRAALAAVPRLTILESSLARHAAVERKLDKHRGLKLTYVDASSLVHLSEGRIRTVWGTDAHLGIEGARVLPGPP